MAKSSKAKTTERERADLKAWWAAAQAKKKAWEKRIKEMEKADDAGLDQKSR